MSENQHEASQPDFSEEAANKAVKNYFDGLKALNDSFDASLGELVNDGVFHPLNYLDKIQRPDMWTPAKGALLRVYRDFREYKDRNYGSADGWPDPLDNGLFPSNLDPIIYKLVSQYIKFVRGPGTNTQVLLSQDTAGAQQDSEQQPAPEQAPPPEMDSISSNEMEILKREVDILILKGKASPEYLAELLAHLNKAQAKELADYVFMAKELAGDLQIEPRVNKHKDLPAN